MRQTLTNLRSYYKYLVDLGVIPDNPVEHIEAVVVAKSTPKWLNRNEQNSLIRCVRSHGDIRELAIITLLLHTGLRVQELCDLKVTDIELSERKGKVTVRCGKHSRRREVPLNKDGRRVLQQYFNSVTINDGSYLFSSQRSEQMTTRAVQHTITKYRNLTGIKHLTAHSLRHSFGHELVSHKVPLDIAARLMGHQKKNGMPNIEMTLVYTAPGEEDLRQAMEELSWI